jgi:hypothetical protein
VGFVGIYFIYFVMATCSRCDEQQGVLYCIECAAVFCEACSVELHSKGKWKVHQVNPIVNKTENNTQVLIEIHLKLCFLKMKCCSEFFVEKYRWSIVYLFHILHFGC